MNFLIKGLNLVSHHEAERHTYIKTKTGASSISFPSEGTNKDTERMQIGEQQGTDECVNNEHYGLRPGNIKAYK